MNFKPSKAFANEKLESFIEKGLITYSKLRNFDYGPNQRTIFLVYHHMYLMGLLVKKK